MINPYQNRFFFFFAFGAGAADGAAAGSEARRVAAVSEGMLVLGTTTGSCAGCAAGNGPEPGADGVGAARFLTGLSAAALS
ncbi:MAG TPA: hypothetical protein PLW66_14385, partial [Saprospiraceae bacterium]|nr:hypothetical protein [Saprospiraceae bacterium]